MKNDFYRILRNLNASIVKILEESSEGLEIRNKGKKGNFWERMKLDRTEVLDLDFKLLFR